MARFAILILLLTGLPIRAGTDTLPRYDLKLKLDTSAHRADFTETITWTNRSHTPTRELVVNFYPHYAIPEGDFLLLAKTLELLRLNPRAGIDRHGRAGSIRGITLAGKPLVFQYQADNPTAFTIALPDEVKPGQSVTVEIEAAIALPNKQGRWGHWQGVHSLVNALPVAAYHDDQGWHAMPFVPWHQPFWNEAGHYTASITLPAGEKLACSAPVKRTTTNDDGTTTIVTAPFLGRDFVLLSSPAYKETLRSLTLPSGKVIALKCLAFEKHQWYADRLLDFVAAAIPVYSGWFGDFPHDQFTVAEAFFGWNGNECAGLVMIDERVFDSPHLADGYVEYLISHETCHQWWYNLVGTNGYAETFMDEGAATFFTHKMLDQRHGKNNPFLHWRKELAWLPNINRDNYRQSGMAAAIGKNQVQPAAGELPGFGHLIGLFNGAYDRGSKIYGMIEARLGEEAFDDFIHDLVKKYSYEVLQASDLKKELSDYTGQNWDKFYDDWVYGKDLVDWKIVKVVGVSTLASISPYAAQLRTRYQLIGWATPRRTSVTVQQAGKIDEPASLAVTFQDGSPLRIPIVPTRAVPGDEHQTSVTEIGEGKYRVEFSTKGDPVKLAIDPERVLLDANPGNNVWNNPPRVTFTPLYTTLNETDLTNDYDRWNFGGGPWIGGSFYPDPWYVKSTMFGARAAAYRTQVFNGGVYGAYRTDYRDIVIGADGLFDHAPHSKMQLGYSVERRVAGPYGDVNGSDSATRASAFARYVFDYSASLYLPPMQYVEAFTTYQDNFLPFARTASPGAVRPEYTFLNGLHYRLNLNTPYWDPECGAWVDLVYGGGLAQLESRKPLNELRGELALVKKLPDWCLLGPLADSRLAIRGVALGATPDQGQFYALGGGTLFRGFDLAERQGSMLWVANAELRLPLARDVDWNVLDSTVGGRNLWLAAFYDVGEVYANGRSVGGVAHALGAGLRMDIALFSFIERATLRFDAAKTINAASPFQFWFGVQHAF